MYIGAMATSLAEIPWVVCDFETTGIHPGYHHRVVEIGLVYGTGPEIEGEWTTTVNPRRDVTASEIHGLRGADVMDSPTFDQIVGSVLEIFNGRVPVAHNASFDRRFFMSELEHAGIATYDSEWFCTLRAMSQLGFHPANLEACCVSCGVELADAHEALADARGCAGLIIHEYVDFEPAMARVAPFVLSGTQLSTAPARPRGAASERVGRRLSQIALDLDAESSADSADTEAYFALLTRALEDRRITDDEYAALLACANDLRLSGSEVNRIHRSYLAALKKKFLEDGHLSDAEQRDLDAVTSLLGISEQDLIGADDEGTTTSISTESLAGQTVCFTGELEATICGSAISRSHAQTLAEEAGLIVKSGVSKKLAILVTVDPESLSGKARKARDIGVRIMAERTFWHAINVHVD